MVSCPRRVLIWVSVEGEVYEGLCLLVVTECQDPGLCKCAPLESISRGIGFKYQPHAGPVASCDLFPWLGRQSYSL